MSPGAVDGRSSRARLGPAETLVLSARAPEPLSSKPGDSTPSGSVLRHDRSSRVKRSIKIADEVVDRFDADRESHQVIGRDET